MELQVLIRAILALCWHQAWSRQEVAGVSRNIDIQCLGLSEEQLVPNLGVFWIINGSVHGLLQVPQEFVICGQEFGCDFNHLIIPIVLDEMNGYTFQCISINYHTNTVYQGRRIELIVISLPTNGNFNAPLENYTVRHDIVELDYTQFSVGPVNTSIGWTYSNLTCKPAVFTIEGYDDRDAILTGHPTTPVLTLNSTSTLVLFPTSYITNSSLYLRLLAYDVSGTACAQDSANRYYQLNDNVAVPIHKSPDEIVTCIPIPVELSSGHDYSSLEVLWPEKRSSPGKFCYCPPYEGQHHLFSRCISTTSCNTDYSIRVKNNSVCFAGLSHELANIPVYFTLLDFCIHHRCIVRSVVATFIVLAPPPPPVVNSTNTSVCFWSMSPVEYYLVNVTDASGNNTSLSGTYNTSHCLNITSDLYSYQCGLLTVSVAAVVGVGTSSKTVIKIEISRKTVNTEGVLNICHQSKGSLNFQLHFHAILTCTEWSNFSKLVKFQRIATELAVFIQGRCDCPFSSTLITSPQFKCLQASYLVTYRASVNMTNLPEQLNRSKLISVLEEWPLIHRSILIQGERMSVDDTCPVIIQSLQDEECVARAYTVATVPLNTFITVLAVTVLALVAMVMAVILMYTWRYRKLVQKNHTLSASQQIVMEVRDHPSPPISVSSHLSRDPINICAPLYEEIQEVPINVNSDNSSRGAEYQLTQCPAYVAIDRVHA